MDLPRGKDVYKRQALTTAELPLAPVIGTRAFYGCSKLNTIMTYYGEQALKSVGTDAFWRDSDTGGTLYIGIRYDYPEAADAFREYDWAASNRSALHYEDVYGVSLDASDVYKRQEYARSGRCQSG